MMDTVMYIIVRGAVYITDPIFLVGAVAVGLISGTYKVLLILSLVLGAAFVGIVAFLLSSQQLKFNPVEGVSIFLAAVFWCSAIWGVKMLVKKGMAK